MKKAFTLVEILIVITIISILSAITAGVLGSAKARAKTTVCASNQRQLATGLLLYMQDHSDLMPVGSPFVTWSEPIVTYLKTKPTNLTCPEYPKISYIRFGERAIGHAINGCVMGTGSFPNPSAMVMLADVADLRNYPANSETVPVPYLWRPNSAKYTAEMCAVLQWTCTISGRFGAERHRNRGNYTFMDGHTKLLPESAFRVAIAGKDPCPTDLKFMNGSPGEPAFAPVP